MKNPIFLSLASLAVICSGVSGLAQATFSRADEDCEIKDNTLACALAWLEYEGCKAEGTQICVEPCCEISYTTDDLKNLDRCELERIVAAAKGVSLKDWYSGR